MATLDPKLLLYCFYKKGNMLAEFTLILLIAGSVSMDLKKKEFFILRWNNKRSYMKIFIKKPTSIHETFPTSKPMVPEHRYR